MKGCGLPENAILYPGSAYAGQHFVLPLEIARPLGKDNFLLAQAKCENFYALANITIGI
jgi:hypothetical protein